MVRAAEVRVGVAWAAAEKVEAAVEKVEATATAAEALAEAEMVKLARVVVAKAVEGWAAAAAAAAAATTVEVATTREEAALGCTCRT